MKNKYKPKHKKKIKLESPPPPPPLIVIEKFETYMFGAAHYASFKFKSISEEEFKQMIISRKIKSYIQTIELAEALSKVTERNIKPIKLDRWHYANAESLYNSDKFVIVQNVHLLCNDTDLNYFECTLSGDGGRSYEGYYYPSPFEKCLRF